MELPLRSLALALVPLVLTGCGNDNPPPVSSEPTAQPFERATASRPVPLPETDQSLASEEYIRLGLPAHDRPWSGLDMVKAEEVLTSLATSGNRRQLPRFESERSGEVFARLASTENLDLFKDQSLPLPARLQQTGAYLQSQSKIMKLYLSARLRNEVGDSELVELIGAQLYLVVILQEQVGEMLPILDKNDPTYPVRMQGLKQMKQGLATVVMGGLQTLSERESYRSSELHRLLGYLGDTFPTLIPHLSPASRSEAMHRLETLRDDPASHDLRPELEKLHSKVKAALETGDDS